MENESPLYLKNFLTFRFARVQAKLNAQGARLLKEVAGLSLAQWRIIAILGSDGETTSSELSRNAQIDKGLLSRKLKQLIAQKIVMSTPHKTDGRVLLLSLTDKGQKIFTDTLPHMQERQEKLRGLFSEQELSDINNAITKLEASLDAEAG